MKAIIFSAGLGTRFKPWTDQHPKALAPVHGKSLLQRNIEYLQQYGIRDVVVNVHHFADQIEEAIAVNKGWGSAVHISDERDLVLETGGGLLKAASLLDTENFVAFNVDILTDLPLDKMIEQHRVTGALATLAVSQRKTTRYFLFDETDQLCGWRHTGTGEEKIRRHGYNYYEKAFSGIHVFSQQIFANMTREGKFSTVDLYLDLAADHLILSYDHTGAAFIDVGKPDSIAQAEALFPA